MVTHEIVRDPERAAALVEEWDELAEACHAGPFSRPTYALSWWRHLGSGRLLVATVREDGRLVALAPLHERRLGPLWLVRWLGHGLGTVAEALVRPGHEQAAEQLWASIAAPRRVLQLLECRSGSPALAALETDTPRRRTRTTVRDLCPVVALPADRTPFLDGPERRRLRRTLSVARRRVEEAGLRHHVTVVDDGDAFEAALPVITSVFDAAEAERSRQHLLREPWGDFTRGYLREAIARGEGLAFVGHLDDRPVSFDLVLVADGALHSWITRFDPDVASYSPGHLLRAASIEHAVASGYDRFDLLLGDGVHKRLWSTDTYDTLEVMSGTPRALAMATSALRAVEDVKRRLP